MVIRYPRLQYAAVTAVLLGCLSIAYCADAEIKKKETLPEFADIEKTVVGYFKLLEGYQAGGILSRSEVEAVYKLLARQGWKVPKWKLFLQRVPADHSFLVRRLRTDDGRKFMAHIAKYPGGYDRLDRMSRLARGQLLVDELIRGPDGHKMIQYMTKTSAGATLGSMLSDTARGKDFNKPTGQIYTVDMLLDALRESYDLVKKARAKGAR